MAAAETQFQASSQKVRNFHEVTYATESWDRARRVIVKAERLPEGPNLRFVVTNLTTPTPQEVYDRRPRKSTMVSTCSAATWRIASGAATGPVRRSHQLPRLPGQPVPLAAVFGGLLLGAE